MKHKGLFVCTLAALLGLAPLTACQGEDEVLDLPPAEIETVSPGELQEIPQETPQTPAPEPEAPPEEPQEPTPEPEPPQEEPHQPAPQEPEKPVKAQYIYIRSNGLNVRAGAGTSYTSLGTVESDILMKYAGKTGNWYQTYYKGRTAYVSADSRYTSVTLLDEGEKDVENVIEEGLRRLGVPYVYGAVRLHDGDGNFLKGFTVKQFDCSSLMQYIFYQGAGKLLNTTTRTQVKQGTAVAKADIKRGDLLFFTNASRKNNTGIERVGHVALYLGDNYILHTASDYAKVEQISATRWSYFITARRIL